MFPNNTSPLVHQFCSSAQIIISQNKIHKWIIIDMQNLVLMFVQCFGNFCPGKTDIILSYLRLALYNYKTENASYLWPGFSQCLFLFQCFLLFNNYSITLDCQMLFVFTFLFFASATESSKSLSACMPFVLQRKQLMYILPPLR